MSNIHDDGFHEIQLNGKQLVFLFMAATVVSVVIFLIGVMVGRSVGEQRASAAETATLDDVPAPDLPPAGAPDAPAPGSDPTKASAPTSVEDLSYFNRLEGEKKPVETVKPVAAKPSPTPAPPAAPPPPATQTAVAGGNAAKLPAARPAAPPPAAAAERAASVSPGQGWVVQIGALTAANEANAMAERWTARGYRAYVQRPANGSPNTMYRVRIGPYKTHAEALAAEAKLKKEGQAITWVTQP